MSFPISPQEYKDQECEWYSDSDVSNTDWLSIIRFH